MYIINVYFLDYIKHTFEFSGDHKSGVLEYSSPEWGHTSGVSGHHKSGGLEV
jgi:hypothetical protein